MTIFLKRFDSASANTRKGLPLIMLHGWGLNHHVWSAVAERLQVHRSVITPDLPGHGRSSMPSAAYGLEKVSAMMVAAIQQEIAGQQAIILGWSLGGLLVMHMAIHEPDMFAGLVLLSSTPRFVKNSPDWPYGMAPEILAGFADELEQDYHTTVQRFLALQSMGSLRAKQEIQFLRQSLLDENFAPQAEGLAGGLRLLQTADLRDDVRHITCPGLIINGERDRLVNPATGPILSKLIPHSKHILIKGAGHAPFISHQDTFIELIEAFCNKHG